MKPLTVMNEAIEVGDKITLLNKETSNVGFLEVTKIGTTYIYGISMYYDIQLNEFSRHYNESRWDMHLYDLLKGTRIDLRKEYMTYCSKLYDWKDLHNKIEREREWQIRQEVRERVEQEMKAWEQLHPKPEPPTFTKALNTS